MKNPIVAIALLAPVVQGLFRGGESGIPRGTNAGVVGVESVTGIDVDDDIDRTSSSSSSSSRRCLAFEGTFRSISDVVVPLPPTSEEEEEEGDDDDDGRRASSSSRPSARDLLGFFADPRHRDLALKGGGNPCERVPMTPRLRERWKDAAGIVRGTPPRRRRRFDDDDLSQDDLSQEDDDDDEVVLEVRSEVPIVPGLALEAVSTTACKTLRGDVDVDIDDDVNENENENENDRSRQSFPCWEFTLLEETYRPVGTKRLTRIFDGVVTGNDGVGETAEQPIARTTRADGFRGGGASAASDASSSRQRTTRALSRVGLIADDGDDENDGGLRIRYYGRVELALPPSLSLLPMPERLVRSIVNRSIRKQLERECRRSTEGLADALRLWWRDEQQRERRRRRSDGANGSGSSPAAERPAVESGWMWDAVM